MRTTAILLAFATMLVPAFGQGGCSLTTTFTSNNGFDGNMFDLKATNPAGVTITGFDVNIDPGTYDMEVWWRTGSYLGFESSNAGWTQAGPTVSVTSLGTDVPTPLPIPVNVFIPSGQTHGFYVTCVSGNMNYTNGTVQGALFASNPDLEFYEGHGGAYFALANVPRVFNGNIYYTYPGQVTDWQVNTASLAMTMDGVQASPCGPAMVSRSIQSACGPVVPVTADFNVSSNLPGANYDAVISILPLAPGSTPPGTTLPDGQLLNIDLGGGFIWLSSGGSSPVNLQLPGPPPVGNPTQVDYTVTFSFSSAVGASFQGVVFDTAAPLGFTLSQATRFDVFDQIPTTSPGPTSVSTNVSLNVTEGPTCWCAGIPFYGQIYSVINVSPKGRVLFGGTDTDGSATTTEAMTDFPFVGFWTDLDPSEGGTGLVTLSNPALGVVRVDWSNVWYNTGGPGNTFGIQFDCNTGAVQIDGLQGIMPNPASPASTLDVQFLGMSPGNLLGATDPGLQTFGIGLSGSPLATTDMLYELNDPAVSLSGVPAAVTAGVGTIQFVPSAGFAPNYDWIGS